MKQSNFNSLTSISPIDGRYREQVGEISNHISEFVLIKQRIEIELHYLIALSKVGILNKFSTTQLKILNQFIQDFDLKEAEKVKEIEDKTHHDVKAVEYYIKQKMFSTSLSEVLEFIHFGLTSEDINNISIRLMLTEANKNVMIPSLDKLMEEISNQANKYKNLPMLARTHGQPAVPTTLGKEFLVFSERLNTEIKILKTFKFRAKLNGAVGNYSALHFSYPKINWKKFSKEFISGFGLETNLITTQIAPYEDITYFFQTIQRINGILLDFNQDMWRYISDNYFIQINKRGEIGSSTMPQKINPILFENSEGNLTMANSLINGFVDKLPISRLQRDLSGSTISRNFGVTLAYSLLAYKNSLSALSRIQANEKEIKEDLNKDWSILSEAVQVYLKKNGINNGYELIKDLTRGEKINEDRWKKIIDKLPISNSQKSDLKLLTPQNYLGITF